jgi:hypothetical protein
MLLSDRNATDMTNTTQTAAIYCKAEALTPRLKPGVCALRTSINNAGVMDVPAVPPTASTGRPPPTTTARSC